MFFKIAGLYKKRISLAMIFALLGSLLLSSGLLQKPAVAEEPVTLAKWDGSGTGTPGDNASMNVPTTGDTISANRDKKITLTGATFTGFTAGPPTSGVDVASANNWHEGDYWEASVTTTGYSGIKVSSKQRGSNTGPRDFQLEYSLDRSTWNTVTQGTVTVANDWTTGVLTDVPLPADADDQSIVYLRWVVTSSKSVSGGTIGTTGTSRIADVVVTGIPLGSGGTGGGGSGGGGTGGSGGTGGGTGGSGGSGGSQGYRPGDVVISQIYVNGGNNGAFYKVDFVELYNRTDHDINFNNQWSIVYASSGATGFNAGTPLSGTIKAHGYYLIAGGGGSNGADLPVTPDQTTSLNFSASVGGIIALAQKAAALAGDDDPDLVDLVAYGNGTQTHKISTAHWGQPFFAANIGSGTILRKTDTGSDPRVALGIGNGFFSKDNSKDLVLNVPFNTSNPEEIEIRNSKHMVSPDAAKITFTNSGGNASVTGAADSVPASSHVKAYVVDGSGVAPTVTSVGEAVAATDGSFALSFTDPGNHQQVFLTHTDLSQPVPTESAYARVDLSGNSGAVTPIGDLRANDAKGLPLHIGYRTTIEGVATTANQALGSEKTNFYLQDATGGIDVIGGNDPGVSIQPGRKVKVAGYPVFAAGQLQFLAISITDEGDGTAPAAEAIELASLNDYAKAEPLEGKLVSLSGKVTSIPSSGPDYNVTIADENGNAAVVRILGSSGINVADAIAEGETFRFTGIVGQADWSSPYMSGYFVVLRTAADIKGDLQLTHTPLAKAYIGVDVNFRAQAKYADSVTLYYKGESDSSYTPVPMETADNVNYNGKIPKGNVPAGKFMYYIEAKSDGQTKNAGSSSEPFVVPVVEDTDGPAYFNFVPADGEQIETMHPAISVEMEDPHGVDVASVHIQIDAKDLTSKAKITETRIDLPLTPEDDLSEGQHTVTVTAKDKNGYESTKSWTFTVAQRFAGGNHYYGSTHNHTQISADAHGDPEEALKAAQYHDYNWFAFSDHSHDIDPELRGSDSVDHKGMPERTGGQEWQLTKRLTDEYTKDGGFVVFPSFEMTSTTWGHSNVFGTTNFVDRMQNGGIYQDLSKYYAWILTYDDIAAQFNHPTWPAPTPFNGFIPYDRNVDKLFTMIEVGNGSGHYSYFNAEGKFFKALDLGWHVAPTYGEDNHDATWGQTKKRTVIVAKDLTRDSLLDSMRNMHVYMTEDPNFKLDVSASGWYMGSTTDTKSLNFDISGTDAVWEEKTDPKYSYLTSPTNDNIDKVELITNGGVVLDTYKPSGDATSFHWTPSYSVAGGQQWFVVRVTQKDGDRIYSAPIWSPEEPLSVKVNYISAVEGGIVGGTPATLEAGVSNLGTLDVKNITARFYYDQIDDSHLIGDAAIDSLPANQSDTVRVAWPDPVPGEHKIIVALSSTDFDLGSNKFEEDFDVKAPLHKTIMIDASKNNENTTKDTGTYKDNLKLFTTQMRQAGYTVVENTSPITDDVLQGVSVLFMTHPASKYSPEEIAAIDRFVKGGGSLFLAEKSNFGGTNQNLNDILTGIGSTILVNDDEAADESPEGNFFGDHHKYNYAVRAHPAPAANHTLTDFVPTIEYFSGASLAGNDGSGNKVPLTDSDRVAILVRGNETTFQYDKQVKADTALYNVQPSPPPGDVSGGSAIPLVASETLGNGRIVVSGMNIFNDKQMDESYNPKGNNEFALNAMNWLSHLEPKVIPIQDAHKLPEGTPVVVQGTVASAAGVFYDAVYVQDDTGGIMAYKEVPEGSLKLGDVIRVYGRISNFENNLEVEFDGFDKSIVKIGSGPPVEPKPVSTRDSVSDAYQGQLVKVTGQVTAIPDSNSYVIDDGSGPVLVFVDGYIADQSGPPPQVAVGDTLEAVGFSGKYSGGDRIRVRDTKELVKITGGAGGGGETGGGGGSSGGSSGTVSVPIPAKDGGQVNLGDFVLVIVPPGAFSKDTQVNIQSVVPSQQPAPSAGMMPVSQVFEITRDSAGTFNKQVTIRIQFDSAQVGGSTVAIFYYDEQQKRWVQLPTTVEGNVAIATVNHFTKFAVFAVTPSGGGGGGGSSSGPVLQRVDLDNSSYSLKVGESHSIAVWAVYAGGWKQDVTGLSTYTSSNPAVAEVDSRGRVTGKAPGTAEITVSYQGQSVKATVQVTQAESTQPSPPTPGQPTPGQSTPGQPSPGAVRLSDVHGHWAESLVNQAVGQGWVKGYPDGKFHPDEAVTRAQFAVLLAKALGLAVPEGTAALPFADGATVPDWARPSVAACVQAGILHGYEDGTFRADAPISRAEMAVMTAKALGLTADPWAVTGFGDDPSIPAWAKAHVAAVKEAGLMVGRGENRFEPTGITTRAEAVAVLLQARERSASGPPSASGPGGP